MVRGRPFPRGHLKRGGRKRGTPNRVTREVREFLAELCDDAEVQQAVRARIIKGETSAFFRALEHVKGKARESVELSVSGDIAARLEEARRRLASEKH